MNPCLLTIPKGDTAKKYLWASVKTDIIVETVVLFAFLWFFQQYHTLCLENFRIFHSKNK